MLRGISTNRNISNISPCLKSAGIEFVCRYYSSTTKQPEKRLTPDEVKSILAAGLRIVTVYEDGPTNVGYFSRSRGNQDGQHAHAFASTVGQPAGSAIYFAVDYDALDSDVKGPIEQYFEGVREGLAAAGGGNAQYAIGVYGSGRVCEHIKEFKKLARYSWLAESHGWAGHSHYLQLPPDIRQEVATSTLCRLSAGVGGHYEDNFASGDIGAFPTLEVGSVAAPTAPIAVPSTKGAPSAYVRHVVNLANQQYDKYHLSNEEHPPLSDQIRQYWEELGITFPGVKTAWSAVFVSWIMRTAGASASEFKASTAHSRFVFWAINNLKNNIGLFHGHRLEDYAPQVGDIIHNNRGGQNITYDFAAAHKAYESHSAVVVEIGSDKDGNYAITIGGNEGDTVGRKRVALHTDGTVRQRTPNPYICVIQNLK